MDLTDEQAARAYRRLCEIRNRHPGIPCACEFDDEPDGDIVSWCSFHAEVRADRDTFREILLGWVTAYEDLHFNLAVVEATRKALGQKT